MSENECNLLDELIAKGLDKAYIKMLREKAALNQTVITVDDNGATVAVPAKQLLAKFLNTD